MVAAANKMTQDASQQFLLLNDRVTATPHVYQGDVVYHLSLDGSSRYFRIGFVEYSFLSLLNGETTFGSALALTARNHGPQALTRDAATQLCEFAVKSGIASEKETVAKSDSPNHSAGRWNPFWIRIPFGSPERLLTIIEPRLKWLLSPLAVTSGLLAIAIAVSCLVHQWSRFQTAATNVFSTDNWLWLLLVWVGLKSIHELGHALACKRQGEDVHEAGIILLFFAPLAYVDVTSSWKIPNRWPRIAVALAGMYLELLVAALAVFAWMFVESALLSNLLYNVIVMASLTTILFNANPLMKFDGYYVLSDLAELPNLQQDSTATLKNAANRLLWGNTQPIATISDRKTALFSYAVAAMIWKLLICTTMLLAASVMWEGAGVVLAVAGAIAWFGLPVMAFFQQVMKLWKIQRTRCLRGMFIGTVCVASLVGIVACLPAPFTATAPGIVELPESHRCRMEVDGFINQVHVKDGDAVTSGQLLLTLKNEDLENRYRDLQLEREKQRVIKMAAAQTYDLQAATLAQQTENSLTEKLQQLEPRIAALTVKAPCDGIVVGRLLNHLQGTYVEEGDEVVSVDDQKSRRLRISLSQEDFATAKSMQQQTVKTKVGVHKIESAVLDRVIPRASRRVFHPALAASEGGLLPVVAAEKSGDDGDQWEFTEQRFVAIVTLPEHGPETLPGQTGRVTIGRRDETMARWIVRRGRKWIRDQLKTL